MTITINTATRTATLADPDCFAASEATPITVLGAAGTDATLQALLILTDGTVLALCDTFNESPTAVFVGVLDLRTSAVQAAFAGKRPDERLPAILSIGDASRLWVCQGVEVANNPLALAPVAPDPATIYLTTELFAEISDLGDDPTFAEVIATVKAILTGVKQ